MASMKAQPITNRQVQVTNAGTWHPRMGLAKLGWNLDLHHKLVFSLEGLEIQKQPTKIIIVDPHNLLRSDALNIL